MNAKAVKAERRQIRRVLGDDAARQVGQVANEVRLMQAKVDDLGVRMKQREQDSGLQADRFYDLSARYHAFAHQSFWRRLRWLLRGR